MVEKNLIVNYKNGLITKSKIRKDCRFYTKNLKTVVIGDNITRIKDSAFKGFENLESVVIGENVEYISRECFMNCTKLKSVDFSKCKKLTQISRDAFAFCCSLDNVVLPSTLVSIGDYAFFGCSSLSHCELNDGLATIRHFAFDGCADDLVNNIHIPESIDGLYSGYPIGAREDGKKTFLSPEYRSPWFDECDDDFNGNSYMIGLSNDSFGSDIEYVDGWYMNCRENESVVTIKDGTKYICSCAFDESSFKESNVKKVILPDSVEKIMGEAFLCSSIEEVEFGKNVKLIGGMAFMKNKIKRIYYRGQISDWLCIEQHSGVFCDELIIDGKPLKHLIIPEGIQIIPPYSFCGVKSITEITLPSSLKAIGSCAFMSTSIKKINGGENVKYIGEHAFKDMYSDKKHEPPYPSDVLEQLSFQDVFKIFNEINSNDE